MSADATVLLGTVAIEPNRWATFDPTGRPVTDLDEWSGRVRDCGADGLELWDRHLPVDPDEAASLLAELPPVVVFNSYVGFDEDDPDGLATAARNVAATGARGVKFNVGNRPDLLDDYVDRLRRWLGMLPDDVRILCECHEGISIAEDPAVAAELFDRVAPPERLGAIVHSHEPADRVRARFDAYGDRIVHVHVNHLDTASFTVPPLRERRPQLEGFVDLVRSLGFEGTWTLEFVEGVLTEHDEPGALLGQATGDIVELREVLAR